MARTYAAATIAAIQAGGYRYAHLYNLDFSTPIYLTDGPRSIVFDGDTYIPSPHIIKVGKVSETESVRVGSWTVTFSAVDQTYVSLFLSENYIDVRVRYYKVVLDSSNAIIGEPMLKFDGNITDFKGKESGTTSTIDMVCASHWANWDTTQGRLTNLNSQQVYFSTDMGFEFAPDDIKDIAWGKN